jgi:hypothetical protein
MLIQVVDSLLHYTKEKVGDGKMNRNFRRYVPAVAILALVSASAVASIAAGQTAVPVVLNKTSVLPPVPDGVGPLGLVSVTFTDRAPIAATEVVFDVINDQGGFVARIRDYGVFSPGVAISHRFNIGNVSAAGDTVEISSVTLADGAVIDITPVRVMPRTQKRVGYDVRMGPAAR